MPETKTWGPFTGRQLTTIICVIVVAALFPVGAWAVSGSSVFVTDSTSGKHASVDSEGQLHVVANVAGAKSWMQSDSPSLAGAYAPRVVVPVGKALVVRQIHVDWFGADGSSDPWVAWIVGNAACNSNISSTSETMDLPNGQDDRVVSFDPGYIVPAGEALCGVKSGAGTFYMKVYGYYVSSSAVGTASVGELSIASAPQH
jgi:hypothetical protein